MNKRYKLVLLLPLFLLVGRATAQSSTNLPTADQLPSVVTTCAVGADVFNDGGVVEALEEKVGEGIEERRRRLNVDEFNSIIKTNLFELFPEEHRLPAYEIYTNCVRDILNISSDEEELVVIDVSPQSAEEIKLEAREILAAQGRHGISEARDKFLEAKEVAPDDPQIAYYLAWLADLNYSLKDEPGYEPYDDPVCQNAIDRYEDTINLFNQSRPTDPISLEMIVEIGHYYINKNRAHEEAVYIYNDHILTEDFDISNPVTYMALVSRGMAYFWLEEYELAGPDFEQALLENPSNQVAYNRGSVYAMYASSRGYDKAIEWYRAAIDGGTVNLIHHNNQEIQLSGEPQLDEAVRDLGFALLLNQKANENDQERQARYREARLEFERAIKIRPDNDLAYIGMGIAEYFEGEVTNAEDTLRTIPLDSPYKGLAERYLEKIEQCRLSGETRCVNHFREVNDLSDISIIPILTSGGISRMFGNVTVHEDSENLDPVLSLEHAALYKGPCP